MTRTALQIAAQLQAALSDGERLAWPLNPAARDGYAALAVWIEGDMPIERLTLDDIRLIPPTLRLDTAPLRRDACAYILLDRRDWIVLARIGAKESVRVTRESFAYPEPMLVWCGWRGERGSIVTGCINLVHSPTTATLRLAAGKNYGELGAADITQADADDDLLMAAQCFARFFGVR